MFYYFEAIDLAITHAVLLLLTRMTLQIMHFCESVEACCYFSKQLIYAFIYLFLLDNNADENVLLIFLTTNL